MAAVRWMMAGMAALIVTLPPATVALAQLAPRVDAVVPSFATWRLLAAALLLACGLDAALPGRSYAGPPTPQGHVPRYKDNAVAHAAAANLVFVGGVVAGAWPASVLVDRMGELVVALNSVALALCAYLFHRGRRGLDAEPGPSGHGAIWDFYMGTELYPSVLGGWDVKRLCNCRLSMTYWMLCGWSCVARSAAAHGSVDRALLASASLQWLYLVKFFAWERGYTSCSRPSPALLGPGLLRP